MRWYAKEPFAYKIREEMLKRLIVGQTLAVSFFVVLLLIYFIKEAIEGTEYVEVKPKKLVALEVQNLEPPQPPDVRQQEVVTDEASGSEAALAANAEARAEAASEVAAAVEAGLSAALEGLFSDVSGLPTPTAGATGTGEGVLGSVAAGGLTGLGGTSFGGGAGLGTGEVGFGAGGSGGLGTGTRGTGLGGGAGRGTGMGGRGLRLAVRAQNLKTQTGLRPAAEIQKVVDKNQGAIEECYAAARSSIDAKGKMLVRIIIAPDGAVTNAQVASSTIKNESLNRCVLSKMKRMKFSAIPQKVNQSVDIPYDFREAE
ncbi:MAG: AgmX/PglI C-terminal domain-containing protein [Chloroherpetonaceae bacterium]|nr:AgmX/PglI C-terminal domain-containing protein [Chloroherpetonaceae bacterium]